MESKSTREDDVADDKRSDRSNAAADIGDDMPDPDLKVLTIRIYFYYLC